MPDTTGRRRADCSSPPGWPAHRGWPARPSPWPTAAACCPCRARRIGRCAPMPRVGCWGRSWVRSCVHCLIQQKKTSRDYRKAYPLPRPLPRPRRCPVTARTPCSNLLTHAGCWQAAPTRKAAGCVCGAPMSAARTGNCCTTSAPPRPRRTPPSFHPPRRCSKRRMGASTSFMSDRMHNCTIWPLRRPGWMRQ